MGLRGELSPKTYGNQRYPAFTLNQVNFTRSGRKSIRVHQFAAYCFFGEAMFENGIIVRHLNDDPLDFRKENIALGTDRDNKYDIPLRKRSYMSNRRLTFEEACCIRESFSSGEGSRKLSERFGITQNYVYDIVNFRAWKTEEEYHGR